MSDWETIASTGLSMIAVAISVAAYINGPGPDAPASSVLIYDPDYIAAQIEPYVEAGQDPMAVIDAAVDNAVESGFVVLDSRMEVIAPDSAKLRLQEFVTVGQPLPFQLNSAEPETITVPNTTGLASSPAGSDLADMARQLYGTRPVVTLPAQEQN